MLSPVMESVTFSFHLLTTDLPEDVPTDYPFNIPTIQHFKKITIHPNVTYLIGENGMRRSTLLEAIAVNLGFNPEGGSKNFNFNTLTTHSNLHNHLKISKGVHRKRDGFLLKSESFYNLHLR